MNHGLTDPKYSLRTTTFAPRLKTTLTPPTPMTETFVLGVRYQATYLLIFDERSYRRVMISLSIIPTQHGLIHTKF